MANAEEYDEVTCMTCDPNVVFDMATPEGVIAMSKHLRDVHQVDSKVLAGGMRSHVDGSTWYSSTYEFYDPDKTVRVVRYSRHNRSPDDMMYYEDEEEKVTE